MLVCRPLRWSEDWCHNADWYWKFSCNYCRQYHLLHQLYFLDRSSRSIRVRNIFWILCSIDSAMTERHPSCASLFYPRCCLLGVLAFWLGFYCSGSLANCYLGPDLGYFGVRFESHKNSFWAAVATGLALDDSRGAASSNYKYRRCFCEGSWSLFHTAIIPPCQRTISETKWHLGI